MTSSTAAGLPDEPVLVRTERDFLVDGWLVQPAQNLLVNGTTVIRVRPQLIDILACLATQPGRVVSKSVLLKRVWGDRFVADSGVTRCMAELRGILKDDARRPRIIETITKRGYRLIAPVSPPGSLQTSPHAAGQAFPLSLEAWRRLAPLRSASAMRRCSRRRRAKLVSS